MALRYHTITSKHHDMVKMARALKMRKYRKKYQLFMVEGWHFIDNALQYSSHYNYGIDTIFVTDEAVITPSCEQALLQHNPMMTCYHIPLNVAQHITGKDNPQSIIGLVKTWDIPLITNKDNAFGPHDIIMGLDRVSDPRNLGTIIRTCHAASINMIVLIDSNVDIFAPEVVRASMGSLLADITITSIPSDVLNLYVKQSQLSVSLTSSHHAMSYKDVSYQRPHMLILGAEHDGVNHALYTIPHQAITIPMNERVESLNLSAAAAILLFNML